MLEASHIAPLARYVEGLRQKYPAHEFPDFDPAYGGVNADILFLLEKPGPKTSLRDGGSGLISPCNNDPTAERIWHAMAEADIASARAAHWNAIPFWDGKISFDPQDAAVGLAHLPEVLDLFPRLKVVVLLGQKAWGAERACRSRGLEVVKAYHPAARNRSSRHAAVRQAWAEIPLRFAEAKAIADRC
jgi:hypothetical protein